ncbi:DUF4157 domain-containing protein [Kitasatospora sp. NPDC090091]|uniref:eCIS core domain-containing protein n=1 Tax=Kitasatospora sp. NPDC090091 TaxID=3364081 RepID=UPI00381B936F
MTRGPGRARHAEQAPPLPRTPSVRPAPPPSPHGSPAGLPPGLLGSDFAGVRVHTDPAAVRSARSIGALAYAHGNDIVGEPRLLDPTPAGRALLAHELAHVAEQRRSGRAVVQRRSRAAETGDLLEWWDFASDAVRALGLLESMTPADFDDTLGDMLAGHQVTRLLGRLPGRAEVVRFLRLVGERASDAHKEAVMAGYPFANMTPESQLIVFGRKFEAGRGARPAAPDPALRRLVSADPSAPFTGSGATGTVSADAPMSIGEMWSMRGQAKEAEDRGIEVEDAKYARIPGLEMFYDWSNPAKGALTGPGSWLEGVGAADRKGQADLLLRQPIATRYRGAYAGALPTRAEVIRSAARAHRLSPELVSGIILAEQRDQSKREDAVDYRSTVWTGRTSSIGLGQVEVKTAREKNLFADQVSRSMQTWLAGNTKTSNHAIADMLASDELNIFAVARYLRWVADAGALHSAVSLSKTAARFPGLDFARFAADASTWTEDHVRLIGSEYNSKPWDDVVSGWGRFVLEAYRDVKAAGVF